MLSKIIKPLLTHQPKFNTPFSRHTLLTSNPIIFRCSTPKQYIPLRSLTQDSTILFKTLSPLANTIFKDVFFALAPIALIIVDGLLKSFSYFHLGGFIAAYYLVKHFGKTQVFFRSLIIQQLRCNKKFDKFTFRVPRTPMNMIMGQSIDKYNGLVEEKMKSQVGIQKGARKKEQNRNQQNIEDPLDEENQKKANEFRDFDKTMQLDCIDLEIKKEYIQSIQLHRPKTTKKLCKIYLNRTLFNEQPSSNAFLDIFEMNKKDLDGKNMLIFKIKTINAFPPSLFYLKLDDNQDKKYHDYLIALGEGKTIKII